MASPSGIPELGDLAPGAHIGQLYRNQQDLLDTLVPFFAAGIAQNERCIWVTSEPLRAADARAALALRVPDLATRERNGQIEILDHDAWYAKSGAEGPDDVIQGWLEAEHQALRDGYSGLRVSGNTFWLRSDQWQEFADYEARLHAAFQRRKIVALCSYALSKCDSHDVVDVLRNHSVSLVRAGNSWSVVHGATAALASLDLDDVPPEPERPHTVEFFRTTFPADRIADRLARALAVGHGAAVLANGEHTEALRQAFVRLHVDLDAMVAANRLAFIDAEAVFQRARQYPSGYLGIIEELVLPPLTTLLQANAEVVAYGELVDLFARNRDHDAAVAVETWWNDQVVKYPITLSCGYSLSAFDAADTVDAFKHVCDLHRAHGVDAEAGDSEVMRLRVELAQLTNALAGEMTRRQALEVACETARAGREQLIRLERLAAALGEVTTRLELVDVVTDLVASALQVDGIVIIEETETCDPAMLVGHGVGVDALRSLAQTGLERSIWSADASVLGNSHSTLRTVAALPLYAGGTYLGSCLLGFVTPRPLTAVYRALAQDVVRQIALALDRSKTYERLDHERTRAEDASRAKDEFLAMLGHELRNPLSPILTATQLMHLRGDTGVERERTVIERQVKHMIRLVDDLLDVSRITRGKVELRRRAVELHQIVSQAAELASPALEERAHRFTWEGPESGVVVHADPARLAQVLANLITNAAKYTPPGGDIRLIIQAATSAVSITVRDNGIGIDAKLLPHIFDMFVQGRQGIDRGAGGLGLGLAISKSLCEMHGGTIRARSEGVGKGSEFTIELPRYANTRPSRNNVSGTFPLAMLRGRRVLVVDDNEDAAFLFSEALKRLGHHVDVAYDGPTALACARERPPEIAFLDIGLPVMDGYELAHRLRELGGRPPRLVAVTGYGHSSDRERSRDAGFDLHLVKPIELSAVQDALAKLD